MTTEHPTSSKTCFGICEKILINWSAVTPNAVKEQVNVFLKILKNHSGLEQRYRIALEAVKLLPHYEYKQEPAMPKYVFEKYHLVKDEVATKPIDKQSEFYKKLYANKVAAEYFKDLTDSRADNISNVSWLEEMIRVMQDSKDEDNLPKVIDVYNRYPIKMAHWKRKVYKCP